MNERLVRTEMQRRGRGHRTGGCGCEEAGTSVRFTRASDTKKTLCQPPGAYSDRCNAHNHACIDDISSSFT